MPKKSSAEKINSEKEKIKAAKKQKAAIIESEEEGESLIEIPAPDWKHVLSTGCTLLDLAISGKRTKWGGIPTGVLVEASGSSGSGKSCLLTEVAARVQRKGGGVFFCDPEARLDKEYAEITGLDIKKIGNYEQPDTVTELFEFYEKWETDPDFPNVFCSDSLAALSTKMEMEDGDKMGMRRAKEFSEALRKACRTFAKKNVLMLCSNQIRDGGANGTKTIPGGNAVPFYSSVRLQIAPSYPNGKIKREKTFNGVKKEKVVGISSTITVTKNSLDDPFRKAPLFIIFGYGIDDIRGNLMWLKESTGSKKFVLPDGKEFAAIDKAIEYVEEANLEKQLKNAVRELWLEIEQSFSQKRKKKEL